MGSWYRSPYAIWDFPNVREKDYILRQRFQPIRIKRVLDYAYFSQILAKKSASHYVTGYSGFYIV
jgi:hypothetical protein